MISQHERFLRGVAAGILADPEDVDDVVQLSLHKTWEHLARGQDVNRSWLAVVAGRFAIRTIEGRARRRRSELVAARRLDASSRKPERIELAALRLERYLEGITPADLELLELRFGEGLDSTQIGLRLGMAPATVRSRLQRVLGQLRRRMEETYRAEGRPWRREFLPLLLARSGRRPRLVPALAAVAAVLLVGGLVTALLVGERDAPIDDLGPARGAVDRTIALRPAEDVSPPQDQGPATPEEPAPAATSGSFVSGRVSAIGATGAPHPSALTVGVLDTGHGHDPLAGRQGWLFPGVRSTSVPLASTRVDGDADFRIAVPHGGPFFVTFATEACSNDVAICHFSTSVPVRLTLRLLAELDVRLEGWDPGTVVESLPALDEGERVELEPDGATFRAPGPFIAPVRLRVTSPGGERIEYSIRNERTVIPRLQITRQTVRVIDWRDGSAVTARWTATSRNRQSRERSIEGAADASGVCELPHFDDAAACNYRFWADGYRITDVHVDGQGRIEPPVISLMPSSLMAGVLRRDGRPLAGADVILVVGGSSMMWAVSDSGGRFSLCHRSQRDGTRRFGMSDLLEVEATKPALVVTSAGGVAVCRSALDWAALIDGSLELDLAVPAVHTIRGEDRDGEPIEKFTVRPVLTDADETPTTPVSAVDGVARLSLAGGPWSVEVDAGGFRPARVRIEPGESETIATLREAPQAVTLNLTFVGPGGHAVAGELVHVRNERRNEFPVTGGDGRVVLTLDEDEVVRLRVLGGNGWALSLAEADAIRAEEDADLVVQLRRVCPVPVRVRTPDGRTPSMLAVFARHEQPPFRRVALLEVNSTAVADLTEEPQDVGIFAPGCRAFVQPWSPASDPDRDGIAVTLADGPRLTFFWPDGDQPPPDGATLTMKPLQLRLPFEVGLPWYPDAWWHRQPLTPGGFRSPPLSPGRYEVRITAGERTVYRREVDLDTDLDIGVIEIDR